MNKLVFMQTQFLSKITQLKSDPYGLLGWMFFSFYIVLSIVFYQECVIYQDNASELAFVISGRINPVDFRWGVIPYRIFAVAGPYLQLSLQTIILLTSVWFILFKFLAWLVCHYYLRNTLAGLLLIFSIVLSLEEGFYAQVLQMFEASMYFCILFAVLQNNEFHRKNVIIQSVWVVFLLILIKGTHIMTFLMCPLLFIYYTYNKLSPLKVVGLITMGIISVLYLTINKHPYEERHMDFIWEAIQSNSFSSLSGIFFYFLQEIISLNFLFPILAFVLLAVILVRKQKYWLLAATCAYFILLNVLIIFKLAGYYSSYPLTDDVKYYSQAAFYTVLFLAVALFFYEVSLHEKYRSYFNTRSVYVVLIFILLFYTSRITASGVRKYEYNRYIKHLMTQLRRDFDEKIFIVNPGFLPFRFSKININAEYETLIKSNIHLKESMALYITPFTTPIKYDGKFPVYVGNVYQVEKTDTIDTEKFHYRTMYAPEYFEELSDQYFKFENLNTVVIEQSYMNDFNKSYGFTINEY